MSGPVCWPGTQVPKSMNSGFRIGFKGVDHGYEPGAPAAPAKAPKPQRTSNAFATRNGTIAGMGSGAV